MEINPSLARLRILESIETVRLQREAAPDDERAGCPGCPYFWSCPVPHRAQTVVAPTEVERSDVAALNSSRPAFEPRGAEDIGWTDDWVEDESESGEDLDGQDSSVPDPSPPPRGRRWWRRR